MDSVRRPPAARPRRVGPRIGLFLFLLALGVYLLALRTNFGYDGLMMYRVTESLVLHHSFRVADPIWHMNEPYTFFGLAVSLLLVPLDALGRLLQHDGGRFIVVYEPLVTALTVLGLYALARELRASYRRSLGIALAYAFGSLAWYYGTALFAEPLVAATMVGSLLAVRRYERSGRALWLLLAGACVALSLLARWDSALLVVVPFGIYTLLVVRRTRAIRWSALLPLLVFAAPIVIALAANLWYDWLRYGDPLNLGPRAAFGGAFSTPLPTGIYGLLVSPGAGLLIYVPLVALAAAAFPAFWRRWRLEAALIALLFFVRLVLYAQWSYWDGREWGPRFLVPIVPLLLLALVALPRSVRWRVAAVALGAAGVAVEVIGQLVPFDTIVWPSTAPLVVFAFHLHDAAGSSCLCSRVVDQAASTGMDFNLRYAPLVRQVVLLGQGTVDPVWRSWWPILSALYLIAGAAAGWLWRTASALDATLGTTRAQPQRDALDRELAS